MNARDLGLGAEMDFLKRLCLEKPVPCYTVQSTLFKMLSPIRTLLEYLH